MDNPDFVARFNEGAALSERGDMEGAIGAFREAAALEPDHPGAHFNLGLALHARGDLDGAAAAYRAAIALDASHAEAHCNLGRVLQQQGQLAAALAALKQGHELGTQQPGWRYPSARWVQECERLLGGAI